MKNGFQKVIRAEPGYVICDECDGTGKIKDKLEIPHWWEQSDECIKCEGEGVVDWITFIRGGKK